MRTYDVRFRAKPPGHLHEKCTELPVGATATIRGITFVKAARNSWRNHFRAGMTDAQVASVLAEGPHAITD